MGSFLWPVARTLSGVSGLLVHISPGNVIQQRLTKTGEGRGGEESERQKGDEIEKYLKGKHLAGFDSLVHQGQERTERKFWVSGSRKAQGSLC